MILQINFSKLVWSDNGNNKIKNSDFPIFIKAHCNSFEYSFIIKNEKNHSMNKSDKQV